MEVMNAVAVAIVLGGVSANAAQILTHINPWQKAGCIPELIKVILHHSWPWWHSLLFYAIIATARLELDALKNSVCERDLKKITSILLSYSALWRRPFDYLADYMYLLLHGVDVFKIILCRTTTTTSVLGTAPFSACPAGLLITMETCARLQCATRSACTTRDKVTCSVCNQRAYSNL